MNGEPGGLPGSEAADQIGGAREPELLQRGGGEAGLVPLIAHQHKLSVEAADPRVAVGAIGIAAPLQDIASDEDGLRHDAVTGALKVATNVDQQSARLRSGERFPG